MQRIPTPAELGLPEQFERLRPPQEEALRWLLTRTHRSKGLCAPTGFGKTLVYIMWALITGLPTCIVTENRALQMQLMRDFEAVGLVNLWGRRNYDCGMRDDWSCEDGYAARCPFKGTVNCPSSQAEMRAAASYLVVTNYSKWTASRKFGQGMEHFEQVVFDEAHSAHDALASAMQVVLHAKEIQETVGMDFPAGPDEFVNWKPWAQEVRGEADAIMLATHEAIKTNPQPVLIRRYLHMRNLSKRLNIIATANPRNWVVDGIERGYQFDPIRPGQYSEGTLLLHVPSILFVSATIRPKSMYMVGVPKAESDFIEFDSDFDPSRCPTYFVPTMRVDNRAHSLAPLWVKLDQIAARRTDRNGIVQTISYARQQEVLAASRFRNAMLVNPRGEAATSYIENFRQSPPGTIFVSPSVGTGFDFPGTECEWQFITKIPFPDGRSKIQQARQENDKEYGPYQAASKLQQIAGRGMRSKEDRCENFICDSHLEWFIPKFRHLLAKSFLRFFKTVATVPPPPPKL